MVKVAVILANGFEEIEALAPVDVFRRAGFDCQILGLNSQEVEGSHGIRVQTDQMFSGELSPFDLIVLPGGMPGSVNLRDDDCLISALKRAVEMGKSIAAICAAPIVLDKAGLLDSRCYTCFPGKEADIQSGIHLAENVVVDGPIITSRGAGTSLDFAYKLVDLFGGDGTELAQTMVYKIEK
ncbi:DJ-1 family glyoxalase III [Streptococcus ruminantium]|uniref:DJ-1 family glyoxalase III n=1 Tax=Streptococcus ruminantium TaxID=1917441 RepID=UPI0012DE0921|nr:DJ-1 family glyoxalase III [Streptococcus ruminantium]